MADLRQRGILRASVHGSLRFHSGCYYRDLLTGSMTSYPALIAAVTDAFGEITGVHRTWLDPDGDGKAKVGDPRRALEAYLAMPCASACPSMALQGSWRRAKVSKRCCRYRMCCPACR